MVALTLTKPRTAPRSLLLVVLLLLASLPAFPGAVAQGPGCIASIKDLSVNRIWPALGEEVTVSVLVENRGPRDGTINISLVGNYSDGTTQVFNPSPATAERLLGSNASTNQTTFSITVQVPNVEALKGRAFLKASLSDGRPQGETLTCLHDANLGSVVERTWGFFAGQRPDLMVDVIEWRAGATGGAAMGDTVRFTRYPTHTEDANDPDDAACADGDALQPAASVFRVQLHNLGDGAYHQPLAAGGPLPVWVELRQGGVLIDSRAVGVSLAANGTGTVDTSPWSLVGKAGLYAISVAVHTNTTSAPELSTANNANATPLDPEEPGAVVVRAPSLVGSILGVSETYDPDTTFIAGNFRLENTPEAATSRAGQAPPGGTVCRSRDGGPLVTRIYVDNVTQAENLLEQRVHSMDAGAAFTEPFQWPGDCGASCPILAGVHEFILVVDHGDKINLLDNATRVASVRFALPDVQAPSMGVARIVGFAPGDSPALSIGAPLRFLVNVTDNSNFRDQGRVVLELTDPDGATFQKSMAVDPVSSRNATNWTFDAAGDPANFSKPGVYSWVARAFDSLDNTNATAAFTFRLEEFLKDIADVHIVVCPAPLANDVEPPAQNCGAPGNASQIAWGNYSGGVDRGTNVVRVTFKVPPTVTVNNVALNNTGLARADVLKNTSVAITTPDGVLLGNFSVRDVCFTPTGAEAASCANAFDACGPTAPSCFNHTFRAVVGGDLPSTAVNEAPTPPACSAETGTTRANFSAPGQWNLTLWVGDAACRFRGHNLSVGQANMSLAFQLWDREPARLSNGVLPGTVDAGSNLTFRVEARDNLKVVHPFVRVTRLVLPNGTPVPVGKSYPMLGPSGGPPENPQRNGTYELSLPTGLGHDLDAAGRYEWFFGVIDANRTTTWSNGVQGSALQNCAPPCAPTVPFESTVRDTRQAAISNDTVAFADGTRAPNDLFEVGAPVVFQADIVEQTRFTATAVVRNATTGSTVLQLPLQLLEGTRYRTAPYNTSLEGSADSLGAGSYSVSIQVVDSAGVSSATSPRSFTVVRDLAPQFSGHTPAPDGFGSPAVRASVNLTDAHGVDLASISAQVQVGNGTAAPAAGLLTNTTRTENGRPVGVQVSFLLGAVGHGDLVTLTVGASDLAAAGKEAFNGTTTWNFTADALAPVTTLACAPSHPAGCAGAPVAVRGDSVLNLSAVDPDPAQAAEAGVSALRYQVTVPGVSDTVVDAPGAAAGFAVSRFVAQEGPFTVTFRAFDAAGNAEAPRTVSFTVDNTGPQVQGPVAVTPTPSGWVVNATIADVPSDVREVRLFTRTGVTGYETRLMQRQAGSLLWSGTVPGAPRGVQVCYYLEAVDNLGNVGGVGTASAPRCFDSENHPPLLNVLSPREGEDVGDSLTVRWQVSDLDGDPVNVALAYRRATDVQLTPVSLSAEEQGARTKVLDTADLVPGDYVLRAEAFDNQLFNNRTSRSVNFTVGGEGGGLERPTLDRPVVAPGEAVRVVVEIPRAAEAVEARLLRGTQVVAAEDMEQDPPGSRFWAASFRISDPGVYQVEVRGTYEDGTPFSVRAASTLTVQTGPFGAGLDAIVIILLGAAVMALGVLGLRRRGWL